ncbi:MAG: hypothetical protein AAFO82_02620 [Bacteroidota bacterium]
MKNISTILLWVFIVLNCMSAQKIQHNIEKEFARFADAQMKRNYSTMVYYLNEKMVFDLGRDSLVRYFEQKNESEHFSIQKENIRLKRIGEMQRIEGVQYVILDYSEIQLHKSLSTNTVFPDTLVLSNFEKQYGQENVRYSSANKIYEIFRDGKIIANSSNGTAWKFVFYNASEIPTLARWIPEQVFQSLYNIFEGKIIYDQVVKDKPGHSTGMSEVLGKEQTYFIKGNHYKTALSGNIPITQYYLGGDSIYTKVTGVPNLFWIDATLPHDEITNYQITENAATINGILCHRLFVEAAKETATYYYSPLYQADPASFRKHEYGFWRFCIEKTRALPLKTISDTEKTRIEITAKSILPMKLEQEDFELPKLPRAAMPK